MSLPLANDTAAWQLSTGVDGTPSSRRDTRRVRSRKRAADACASGFFFVYDERLFLVMSRHVVFSEPSGTSLIAWKLNCTSIGEVGRIRLVFNSALCLQ
jgi:hypothetical protein